LVSGQTFNATHSLGAPPTSSFLSLTNKNYVTGPRLEWSLPYNTQQHTFLFGPKWKLLDHNRFSLNVWALGGVAKRFALMDPLVLPTDAKPPLVRDLSSPASLTRFMGPNGLAISVGGSLGFKITDRLVYDIVTPEYLYVRGKDSPVRGNPLTHDFRVSGGFRVVLPSLRSR
jgi:hypothetical protein